MSDSSRKPETPMRDRQKVSALCHNFELLLNKKPKSSTSNSLIDLSATLPTHVSTVPIGTHTTRIPISAASSTSAIPIYTVLSGRHPDEPKAPNPPLVKQESVSESELHSDSSGSCEISVNKEFDEESLSEKENDDVEPKEEMVILETKKVYGKAAPPNPPPPVPSHSKVSNKSSISSANTDTVSLSSSVNTVAADANGVPTLKLNGFVGFDSLPYQLVEKCNGHG
ncbi:hypothetical protein QR680_018673 [Steinernema hermaphroditum]|uniref:Uncharacterized protein n=1 Tax=Steinernema hermaphroditum TaxID=289476 RepID=A0AA39HJM2_9BILA|nr:hypothetical protein QR680_018673 [Steinernema hermaphroditum]